MLNLQNQSAYPLKLEIAYGPIKKRKGHSKIKDQIKLNLYEWITHHPQFFQSPISIDCLKVIFGDQTEPKPVPKLLLQVSVREIHNSLVSDPNDSCLKEAR